MTPSISVLDLRQRLPPPHIVDVRSPGEYAAGHIPGAVNIPLEQIEARATDLASCPSVVLVCKSGTRARMAADRLAPHRAGLQVLDGGTAAWIEQGFPAVSSSRSRWALERQVRLGAGLIVLCGLGLAAAVNPMWAWLAAFAGAGLTFAGLTDICAMGSLLARMPWNRPARKAD